ncbi:MAG: N-acetylmuramoyl-L-alanine amidase [bacterium]|nr:N-acetylmuramoyl-L-alanine amidase [bacterium]
MQSLILNSFRMLILSASFLHTCAFSDGDSATDEFVASYSNIFVAKNYLADFFGDDFISREQWQARPSKTGIDHWNKNVTTFAIHHTAGSSSSTADAVKSIQNHQMNTRGWSDIGYHFLVGNDGKIFEGRSLNWQGAHVKGHNAYSVAISALGCFDESECNGIAYPPTTRMTESMLHSMGELVGFLAFKSNITNLNRINVRGHREFPGAATACPGNIIINFMEDIVDIASRTLKSLKQMV